MSYVDVLALEVDQVPCAAPLCTFLCGCKHSFVRFVPATFLVRRAPPSGRSDLTQSDFSSAHVSNVWLLRMIVLCWRASVFGDEYPDHLRLQPTAKFTDEIKFTITFQCRMKPAVRSLVCPEARTVCEFGCAQRLGSR
jgi:hypothetical protein